MFPQAISKVRSWVLGLSDDISTQYNHFRHGLRGYDTSIDRAVKRNLSSIRYTFLALFVVGTLAYTGVLWMSYGVQSGEAEVYSTILIDI